jgi:hypothetical protein
MLYKLKNIGLLWVLLNATIVNAQWPPCIDETRIQPTFQCFQPLFDPVCGCDGYTYRNACQAYNNYGVSFWTGGVCNGFFLDFYPNPTSAFEPMQVRVKFQDNVFDNFSIRVLDFQGHTYLHWRYLNIDRLEIQLDLIGLRPGVYFLIAESGRGQYWFERFIKI